MMTFELESFGKDGPIPGRPIFTDGFPDLKVDVELCQDYRQLIREASS